MGVTKSQLDRCVKIAREFGARKLVLFGSAVDSPRTARDIDLACDGVEEGRLIEFGARLEDELGISIDLVPMSPPTRFSTYVAARGRVLYERQ